MRKTIIVCLLSFTMLCAVYGQDMSLPEWVDSPQNYGEQIYSAQDETTEYIFICGKSKLSGNKRAAMAGAEQSFKTNLLNTVVGNNFALNGIKFPNYDLLNYYFEKSGNSWICYVLGRISKNDVDELRKQIELSSQESEYDYLFSLLGSDSE